NELIKKVNVTENEQYTNIMSKSRITCVQIELVDGTIKEKTVDRATGDADEVELYSKVLAKNQTILESIFGVTKAKRLIENILHLDELKNVNQLSELFVTSK